MEVATTNSKHSATFDETRSGARDVVGNGQRAPTHAVNARSMQWEARNFRSTKLELKICNEQTGLSESSEVREHRCAAAVR